MVKFFWGSILAIFYAYFGYPLVLYAISRRKSVSVKSDDAYLPKVSLIITAHNEARRIEKKIINSLELDYPRENIEILVASDASSDETDKIVQGYADKGIRLVRSPHRGGKEFAQKCAIQQAAYDIIVFSDVATILENDGIRKIVSNFADSSVGCVSSEDRVKDQQGNTSGEGAYVRYEMWLRAMETRVNSVVGLSGSFFAARKAVCQDWPVNIPSDFNTLLNSMRHGLRGISDPKSIGVYNTVSDSRREFERKVRTITRGISALMVNKSLLNPMRYGLFAWQLLSHKLVRWLIPWFMMLALGSNIVLSVKSVFYRVLLLGHGMFYILSLLGSYTKIENVLVKIPKYFVQANYSILVAWFKYLKGERYVTWTPSGR
jgi:glycosyltransferase involved in cell wall biosynthesis